MKSVLCLALAALVFSPAISEAQFGKSPEKLDQRMQKAASDFRLQQADPSTRIPAAILQNAQGLIILHEVKVGFGLGGEAGWGVATVRDAYTGQWSPPAFVASADGSYGLQIGAQKSVTVLCLMDEEGMKMLNDSSLKLGVNVRATAGPNSEGGEAAINNVDSPVLVYSNSGGLFAGAAIEGGGIVAAKKNNLIYYGKNLEQILFRRGTAMTASGVDLINAINGQ